MYLASPQRCRLPGTLPPSADCTPAGNTTGVARSRYALGRARATAALAKLSLLLAYPLPLPLPLPTPTLSGKAVEGVWPQ